MVQVTHSDVENRKNGDVFLYAHAVLAVTARTPSARNNIVAVND